MRFREGSQSSSAPQGDRVRISRTILSGQVLGPVTRVAQPWKTLRATIASPSRFAVARAVTRRDSRRDGNHRPGRSVNSIYRDVQHEAVDGRSGPPRLSCGTCAPSGRRGEERGRKVTTFGESRIEQWNCVLYWMSGCRTCSHCVMSRIKKSKT